MKKILMALMPLAVMAQGYSLEYLISKADRNNYQLKAKELEIKAKNAEVLSKESSFWPTLDIYASHVNAWPTALTSPGETITAGVTLNVDIYDGGRKKALLEAKMLEKRASRFERDAFSKSLTLDIVNRYYGVLKYEALLHALEQQSHELAAQISRMKKFYASGLATQEDIDRLQAEYDENDYAISSTKLALVENRENLQLLTGIRVSGLRYNHFREPKKVYFEPSEATLMIKTGANVIGKNAEAIEAGYKPQVTLSDTYRRSKFNDTKNMIGFDPSEMLLEEENKLSVNVGMRIFDNGKIKHDAESLKYQKMAAESNYIHALRAQKMNFQIAGKRLEAIRDKRKSTQSALKATQSTYHAIVQKFEAGVVDNITYLDALNKMTLARAKDKETAYDYEIAKSIYYFYAGKNPKEYIR